MAFIRVSDQQEQRKYNTEKHYREPEMETRWKEGDPAHCV